MRHLRFLGLALIFLFLTNSPLISQDPPAHATATCNFDDEKQLAVGYEKIAINPKKPPLGHEIPYNKVWAPGGKAMSLFVNSPIRIADKNIPIGGYTMFVIPAEKEWTLIISKSTDISGSYDAHSDLLRAPMESGELSSPESEFSVYFAHVAPSQCNMRLDLAKVRAYVDFHLLP